MTPGLLQLIFSSCHIYKEISALVSENDSLSLIKVESTDLYFLALSKGSSIYILCKNKFLNKVKIIRLFKNYQEVIFCKNTNQII